MAQSPNFKAVDEQKSNIRGALLASIFLMATSAIGPGFITQTATFTAKLGASFAFAILASILIDFVIQLNIWRTVVLSRMRAQDIANAAIPGSGYVLAFFIIFGGLVFNIGNIAGAGMGINAMIGIDAKVGGGFAAVLAIFLFFSKRAGAALDKIIIGLGFIMIAMTIVVAFVAGPPVGEALKQTILPETIDFAVITTIVGGTVGGYITYAGAHRLLDKGAVGEENLAEVTKGALTGIAVTGIMRYALFLAILGTVVAGANIMESSNPAAAAFQFVMGDWGLRAFGVILFAAAITSVIGAAYTSVSFFSAFKKDISDRQRDYCTAAFIVVSLAIYLALGTAPKALLVFAGGFNGLILPIGLTIFTYVGAFRRDLLGNHDYPKWLLVLGALVCLLSWYMGYVSIGPVFAFLSA